MTRYNLKPIRKGDTWKWNLKFYSDKEKTTPLDVSTYDFKVIGKLNGSTVFTWNDADFVQISVSERELTLNKTTTAGYTVGDIEYDFQVDDGSISETWYQGYVTITNQITQ